MLESWYTFFSISPTTINEILNEKLHYNKFITIGGKSLSKKSIFLQDTQISKIRDLATNNRSNYRFKTIGELEVELKKSISCLQYNALLSAIPTDWKTKLLKGEETNLQGKEFQIQHLRIDVKKLSNKTIYQSLAYSKCSPTAKNKWVEYYPFLETINWSNVYILPSIITSDLKLRSFQYTVQPAKSNHPGEIPKVVAPCRWLHFIGSIMIITGISIYLCMHHGRLEEIHLYIGKHV